MPLTNNVPNFVPATPDSPVHASSAGDYFPFVVFGHQRTPDSPVLFGVQGPGIESPVATHATSAQAKHHARLRKVWSMVGNLDLDAIIEQAQTRAGRIEALEAQRDAAIDAVNVTEYATVYAALLFTHGNSALTVRRLLRGLAAQ